MEMKKLFQGCYLNRAVLITGHTGFKGSWLSYWLSQLGARVIGYSLDIPSKPSHFELLNLENDITHIQGDIRDLNRLNEICLQYKPDLIFHLAAQALVRPSYEFPIETFSTNLLGTANVLESIRLNDFIQGMINVTSDKCYENFEDDRAYNEDDRMGGYDPYSASKGGAELVANSYRSSFFNPKVYNGTHEVLLASVRAGNVIGGGDWSLNRLIPDIVKKAFKNGITSIRSPHATRPWQHVLEPLSGYLLVGLRILEKDISISDGWNFGPLNSETLSVGKVVELSAAEWGRIKYKIDIPKDTRHEANLLRLDCKKANDKLKWSPVWNANMAIRKTIQWYRAYYDRQELLTEVQLKDYIMEARLQDKVWTL